ncbi:MAG TPA: hypothetical protein VND94_18960 [Terriglobia bacterium]|nr:hypothetical protein [Terriglobia bacterium]
MNLVRPQNTPSQESPFASKDPAAIAWRRQQMAVDNDIEGVARDPQLDALVASWDAAGMPIDQQLAKLKEYFAGR